MKDYQARGILFEEQLQTRLTESGLIRFHPGVVRGEGADHTEDGWGELTLLLPLLPPLRFYSGFKCYNGRLELSHLRDFYGMLADVEESVSHRNLPDRYTITGCYFSATGFTQAAQEYAWARGISLFSLEQTRLLLPTLALIRGYVRERAEELSFTSREGLLTSFRIYQKQMIFHNQNDFSPFVAIAMLNKTYPVLLCGTGEWLTELYQEAEQGRCLLTAEKAQRYGDECEVRYDLQVNGRALEFCLPGVIRKKLLQRMDYREREGDSLLLDVLFSQDGNPAQLSIAFPAEEWEQGRFELSAGKTE